VKVESQSFSVALTGARRSCAWPGRAFGTGYAQEFVDASFCRDIRGVDCAGVITSGTRISIEDLPRRRDPDDGQTYPTVYLWASTANCVDHLIGFLVSRTGTFYPRNPQVNLRGLEGRQIQSGPLASIRRWLADHSLSEFWHFLGLQEVGIGSVSVKLSTTQESDRYRTYDFRYVKCPGEFRFLVVDSLGNAIPPPDRNVIRSVTITP
jgi:hypothetical protein